MIKIVPCTHQDYLIFLKNEVNINMHPELVPIDGLPMAFLYLADKEILGVATLVDSDMRRHIGAEDVTDENPWLIGLFVKETHRAQGIGVALVNATLEYAKDNYTDIHFNTETASAFYQKNWHIEYIKTKQIKDNNGSMVNSDYFTMNIADNLHEKKVRLKM